MTNVGGDPSAMSGGAQQLHQDGTHIEQMQLAVSSAGGKAAGAVGDPALNGAMERFGSAWSTMLGDTGLQIVTAAQLAASAAGDLSAAGGGH